MPLLAVHISDGVLAWPWLIAGCLVAAGLVALGSRRIADDEVARVGLLTAAFFVASLIHVRLGPTSVHLLLNGLVGVILGVRAAVAIAVGLTLQALLLGHGGYTTLGVNCVVVTVPALLARPLFRRINRGQQPLPGWRELTLAVAWVLHPALLASFGVLFLAEEILSHVGGADARFRAGFAVGALAVVLTALLNSLVLILAGVEDWRLVAVAVFVAHLPLALVEGLVVGCTVSFLGRAKPEMLPGPGSTISYPAGSRRAAPPIAQARR